MKIHLLLVAFLAVASSACKKNGTDAVRSATVSNNSVGFTDTVKVPINDLRTGTYMGVVGGLYPDGINYPSGQYKKDLKKFANDIMPLNGSGAPDSTVGKIGFISLGGSTSGHMMDSLKQKTMRDSSTNPFLKLVNCSNGGGVASFQNISNPNDSYWNHVNRILISSHMTHNQIQVIYLETEDSLTVVGFPKRPYRVKGDIEAAIRVCKLKFPYLKLLYALGRTKTFDDGVNQITNTEPCPYYNGWAWKFMIEDQINGVPGTEYKGDSAVAPLVTWGWYQWADGSAIPRKDGFTWQESDTEDGLHATPEGQDTLTTRFQNFLLTDKYASIWYHN